MKKPIRKAVLPVAGLGTRFLPATKAIPKEMLTVVDRPILQYIVDEAREAGVEHFIFVTGRNKGVIEDHFDSSYELEDTLKRRGKDGAYAALMADLPPPGATSFTRQQMPLGLGHAVWCAREIVGDEPFAVLLPDMVTKPGAHGGRCLLHCVEAYNEFGGNVLAVEEVPPEETPNTASSPPATTTAAPSRSPAWWRSRSPEPRPRTTSSPAATSCSPRSSRSSKWSTRARAARSS